MADQLKRARRVTNIKASYESVTLGEKEPLMLQIVGPDHTRIQVLDAHHHPYDPFIDWTYVLIWESRGAD